MKYFLILLIVCSLIACEKGGGDDDTTPSESTVDTVGRILLSPVRMPGHDTASNYIATYAFYKGGYGTRLNQYDATNSSGTHRIRYVGLEPLFHPDSLEGRGPEIIGWRIAPALKGKPIFEAYDISTGSLYKRYIASKDSVEIVANFSIFGDMVTPSKRIGESFLYYINVKQTDAIRYRKN